MLPEAVAALLVAALTAYTLLGGADFGGGFWDLTAGGARRGARVRGLIARSMSPVWEANHVWLVFALVICWTGFPQAFGSIASTLAIPLLLAAIGIILRGSAFVFRGEAATVGQQRFLGAIFATSSVLTPFFLGAVIGAIASGRVPVGNAEGDPVASWANSTGVLIGVLAVGTGAFLAAVFLAADAARGAQADLVERFRVRALGAGIVVGAIAIGGIFVLRDDARALYDGLTSDGLPAIAVSAAAGVTTLALVARRRFGPARLSAGLAVGAVAVGWAIAQAPEFLPGQLTIDEAAAGHDTLVGILVIAGIGAIVLVPSLVWLFRLFLRGRLDRPFTPIGDPGPDPEAQR